MNTRFIDLDIDSYLLVKQFDTTSLSNHCYEFLLELIINYSSVDIRHLKIVNIKTEIYIRYFK